MKIYSSTVIGALSLMSAEAVQQQADIYYHEKPVLGPSMWNFNPNGLTIYAPNGDILKELPKKMLCKESLNMRTGEMTDDCSYFTATSDGHKYVYAASMSGDHTVQAFDINTGDFAGAMDTCSTPIDMEYHPARQEVYVRCAQEDTDSPGEIDVFSSASLSSDLPMVRFNATARPYGRLAIHSSMGPYGYSLAYDQAYITEMDLSTKEVSNTYEIPDAYGAYDTTFSPVNGHLYFRARVCCSCNSTGADLPSCGRSTPSPVMVKTGPSASDTEQIGICSGGCEGSLADTIGVYEFDTINKVIVGSHNIKEGTGFGANPYASPDGKWIVLAGNDGGQNVRVLKAGKNGELSGSTEDVAMDFEGAGPTNEVVSDMAFIQDENREILVVGANSDNHVVLVDLETFATKKIDLAPGVAESTGGGARMVEWAVGTNYVWVNGGEAKEAYVIEISEGIESASLVNTVSDIPAGQLIFVNNYEHIRATAMAQGSVKTENTVMESSGAASAPESNSDVLSVVGVVLGALGLLAGLGALLLVNQKNSAANVAVPESTPDVEAAADTKTLGSKVVN